MNKEVVFFKTGNHNKVLLFYKISARLSCLIIHEISLQKRRRYWFCKGIVRSTPLSRYICANNQNSCRLYSKDRSTGKFSLENKTEILQSVRSFWKCYKSWTPTQNTRQVKSLSRDCAKDWKICNHHFFCNFSGNELRETFDIPICK